MNSATLTQDQIDTTTMSERADLLRAEGAPIIGVVWQVPCDVEMKKLNNKITWTWYWDDPQQSMTPKAQA